MNLSMFCHCASFARVAYKNHGDLSNVACLSKLCKIGQLDQAIQAADLMHQRGMLITRDDILCLLQECVKRKDLTVAKHVYSLIVACGFEFVSILNDHLIRLFASCGSLHEATKIFGKVAKPSVYTWNAIISAHASLGESEKALELYHRMQHTGIKPDKVIFLCAVKTCGSIRVIGQGRLIHNQIITNGLESDVSVGTSLIDMYCKCGSLEEARTLFDEMPNRDVVLWSAMIAGYAQHGHGLTVLKLFEEMLQVGLKPDRVTFSCTLKACAIVKALVEGLLLHDQIVRNGLQSDVVIGSALVDMYAKCESLKEARRVFDHLPYRDAVLWSAMIAGYADHEEGLLALELFEKMQQEGARPDKVTFLCALKACGSIRAVGQGRLIHDQIKRSGFQSDVVIGNTLVDMYAKSGHLEQARGVFDELQERTVVSWDVMIAGYGQHGYGILALDLFKKMQQEGVIPDKATYPCILKSCSNMGFINQGRQIHCQIINCGHEVDIVIGNALVDMYAKCGSLKEARRTFERLLDRDMVSWGTMISGYTQAGKGLLALELFEKMQQDGTEPDIYTYPCILKACGSIGIIEQGRWIHEQIIRSGLELDTVIGSALVDMYVKCESLEEAHEVFHECSNSDVVSWNVIIAGYTEHQQGLTALDLYEKMQHQGINPDNVTFLCILKACGSLGTIEQGRLIHIQINESELESDVVIGNTLIDMYFKCGSQDEAQKVFDGLSNRSVVSWNTMIAGYSQRDNCTMAFQCFEGMQRDGLKPDGRTYISVLGACSPANEVEKGYWLFKSMTENHGIIPSVEHFDCMVDLLGRAGRLEEAGELLQTMPILSDHSGWTSLLSACRTYSNLELGRLCFDHIVRMDPQCAAGYMLMSNIYSDLHMWEDVCKLEELRNCVAVLKKPGIACIEVNSKMQEFIVGDRSCQCSDKMNAKFNRLTRLMKGQGFVPELNLILQSVLGTDGPFNNRQYEKLTPAFGQLTTIEGTSIRTSNILQVCMNSHIFNSLLSSSKRGKCILKGSYPIFHFKDAQFDSGITFDLRMADCTSIISP